MLHALGNLVRHGYEVPGGEGVAPIRPLGAQVAEQTALPTEFHDDVWVSYSRECNEWLTPKSPKT